LTKCVFAVALTKRTTLLDSHANEEAEGFAAKDWSEFVRFRPDAILVITEDNNPGLRAMRE
jgi:hypothetical protein